MVSRNPDELRKELESIDFEGNVELLSELRSEARETATGQQETLNDIDSKASKILRVNVLLIGVIISTLSIAAKIGGKPATAGPDNGTPTLLLDHFLNLYTKLGVGFLILSTALAALTYTASDYDMSESEAEECRSDREKARASLLSGGERVAKGRQRADGEDD